VATYSATRTALVAHIRAGFTALEIYPDPTDSLTAEDESTGWVELTWSPGAKGPSGGRMGPTSTHYETSFNFTMAVMIPRNAEADAAAWATAWATIDALEALILEAQVGDLSIESVRPVPYGVETGDNHVQIDLQCSGMLESVVEAVSVASLGGIGSTSQVFSEAEAPAVAYRDWVGLEAGLWRPVAALETEPAALGVVSRPPDGTVTITFGGFVELPGHGWTSPTGALYLSQGISPKGQATGTEPLSGLVRQVAQIKDGNSIVVTLGGGAVR
jgi:hypothetical protein